jgi:hypothetical protein
MKCAECRDLLQQEADGEELLGRSVLEQHLRACAACRAFQTGLARIAEAVRHDALPTPSPEFQARLFDAVLADRAHPPVKPTGQTGSSTTWAVVLALAASVLVGLGLYLWRPGTPPGPAPDVVEKLPVAPEPVPGNLRESVREAGSALTALTNRTADEVVEQTRKLIPSVPTPALPTLDPMGPLVEPPGRTFAQAGQVVADGIQPVTDSARRAFDLFLRELPLGPEANPGL